MPEECTIPWFSLADVWQLRGGTQDYIAETAERISPKGIAHSAARLLPAGTVVLSRTASVGFAGVMAEPMATTQDFANWVCGPRLVPEYLLYCFRAMSDDFRRATIGSTHQTIYMPDIRRLTIPVPPVAQQERIVARLRSRLKAIDALVNQKERMIAILAERKQALIKRALTGGLNVEARPMSAQIEWLGAVPAHWAVAPLGSRYVVQLGKMLDSSREVGGERYPYLRNANVQWGRVDISDVNTMPLTDSDRVRYRLRRGDLLVCEGGGNINAVGKSAIWQGEIEDCYYQKALHRLRPFRQGEQPTFLLYCLWFAYTRGVFIAGANPNTVFHLTAEKLRALRLPFPPPTEQLAIIEALDAAVGALDATVARLTDSIHRLRDYRQALIAATVTGRTAIAQEAA